MFRTLRGRKPISFDIVLGAAAPAAEAECSDQKSINIELEDLKCITTAGKRFGPPGR